MSSLLQLDPQMDRALDEREEQPRDTSGIPEVARPSEDRSGAFAAELALSGATQRRPDREEDWRETSEPNRASDDFEDSLLEPAVVRASQHAPLASEGVVPYRRREPTPRRRRRRSARRWFWRLVRLAAVIVPLGLGGWWVTRAPTFALAGWELRGQDQVSQEWLDDVVRPWRGANLVTLELGRLRESLLEHPWVREVRLRKQLPDRLVIEVVEYRPAGTLVIEGRGAFQVSREGRIITRSEGDAFEFTRGVELRVAPELLERDRPAAFAFEEGLVGSDWPLVERALDLAETVATPATGWNGPPKRIDLLGPDDFALSFEGRDFELLLSQGETEEKMRVLDLLLPQILERYSRIEAIDLRFGGRIVLKGAELRTKEASAHDVEISGDSPRSAFDRVSEDQEVGNGQT